MEGIEIRIPKQYNASSSSGTVDTMRIKSFYPDIQLDHFWFSTIFREGTNADELNLLTVVASTIRNNKPEYQWLHFDKDLIPIDLDFIKSMLWEDFNFSLLNHQH